MYASICFYVFVRTTIDLPDVLLRQAKARAALEGITLKELLTAFVEQGLRQETGTAVAQGVTAPPARSPLPVYRRDVAPPMPALTNAELYQLLDEEDAADARPA